MATNANGNGNKATKIMSFDVVDESGDVIGTLKVEPGVRSSQPTASGKGGGKEYIVAECNLGFGDSGSFGGRVTLWEPREKVSTERAIVRSL